MFIHHSCGENWLADSHGGLGRALAENNYFVSDTNYGWGPSGIGDRTDIIDWPEWFTGRRSPEVLSALYRESEQHCEYTRNGSDPGGENQVVMFKSCFPNSNLEGRPTDAAARGEGLTVANAKAIYIELLKYFASRPDKLFVVVTAPPLQDRTHAANARAFNRWLVQDWLTGYGGSNVAVFDFYNVLTGAGHHHRFRGGRVEHTCQPGADSLYYPSDGDDHPSPDGNRRATTEFVPLLNVFYNRWLATKPTEVSPNEPAGNLSEAMTKTEPQPERGASAESKNDTAKPVATTAAKELVDDFEQKPDTWQLFRDNEEQARLEFTRDMEVKHGGKGSLHIRYDLAPANWATCSLVHERPRDWSRFRSLSLYLHADQSDQPLTVVVYAGKSSAELAHFQCRVKTTQEAVDGWQRVDVIWSQLKLPEWDGDAAAKFDPRLAMGVAIAFESPADGSCAGQLWIDDIALEGRMPEP